MIGSGEELRRDRARTIPTAQVPSREGMACPESDPARVVRLPRTLSARCLCSSLASLPAEACGVLVGRSAPGLVDVLRVEAGRNLSTSLARFDLDPGALVAADRRAREHGLAIVGIWHSHVDAPAIPSCADVEGAWEGWVQLIVSLGPGERAELRAWRIEGRRACELTLVIASAPQPTSARSASASAR